MLLVRAMRIAVVAVLAMAPGLAGCGGNGERSVELSGYRAMARIGIGPPVAQRAAPSPPLVLAMDATDVVTVSVPDGRRRKLTRGPTRGLANPRAPTWAPDGRSFAVATDDARAVIIRLGSRMRTSVRDPLFGSLDSFAFSPDGRYLVATAGDPEASHPRPGLYAFDLRRGGRRLALLSGPVSGALSWSPDGHRIAFVRPKLTGPTVVHDGRREPAAPQTLVGGIAVLDLRSGSVRLVTGDGQDPAWSPDGRWIAFVSHRGGRGRSCGEDGCYRNGELDLIRPDGSGRRRLTRTPAGEGTPSWSPDGTRIVARMAPNEFRGHSGLVTLAGDGSGYRVLVAPGAGGDISLGSGAWRPGG
jgi:Tol biopolymer transport system component